MMGAERCQSWMNGTCYCRSAELGNFSLIGRTTYEDFIQRFDTV